MRRPPWRARYLACAWSASRRKGWWSRAKPAKDWDAIARTLRANVDVALTLYRNGSWAA